MTINTDVEVESPLPAPSQPEAVTKAPSPTSNLTQLDELLQPGLSPVFSTESTNSFLQYLQYVSKASVPTLPPSAVLKPDVLTLAISYPHKPSHSTSDDVLISPKIISRIAISVPQLAKDYGYTHFQIWFDVSMFHHRRIYSRFHYCTRRIFPFLALPVLHVSAPDVHATSKPDADFRSSLQSLAASLGFGRIVVNFRNHVADHGEVIHPDNSVITFRPEKCENRHDSLQERFNALVFATITTRLFMRCGMCATERDFFHKVAMNAFPDILAIRTMRPHNAQRLFEKVTWIHGPFADVASFFNEMVSHPKLHSQFEADQEYTSSKVSLRDMIHLWDQLVLPEVAARSIHVRTNGARRDFIAICADVDIPSVALVMEVSPAFGVAKWRSSSSETIDGQSGDLSTIVDDAADESYFDGDGENDIVFEVLRSCLCVLDDGTEFLELTSEIELSLHTGNGGLRAVVEDMLTDAGVLNEGDYVESASLLDVSEDSGLAGTCLESSTCSGRSETF